MELSHGCKTIGGMEWVSAPPCQVFQQVVITYLDVEYSRSIEKGPCCWLKGNILPSFYQTKGSINTNYNTKPDEA